ncbi:Ig-like domain-containing protein [Pseudomonas floridensis]
MMTRRSWWRNGAGIAACLFYTGFVLGEACEVRTMPSSPQMPVVQGHTCYEFSGMPQGSIDWSCSNEDKGATPREKRKVDACPQGAAASCSATLTQEALANERSTSKEPGQATLDIPADAKVITWYYEMPEQAQTRIDCEQTGGTFSYPLK